MMWSKGTQIFLRGYISCFIVTTIHLSVIHLASSWTLDPGDLSAYIQTTSWTCGPAALRAILAYYGIETTEEEVARLAGTDSSGTTFYGLQQAARAYGLKARGERWNWGHLVQEKNPFIAYVGKDHYVVVLGIKDGHVELFDPGIGQIHERKEVFESKWSGEVLAIQGSSSD